ncbi:36509_t:CDS:2, partial [Racocetra persica]
VNNHQNQRQGLKSRTTNDDCKKRSRIETMSNNQNCKFFFCRTGIGTTN